MLDIDKREIQREFVKQKNKHMLYRIIGALVYFAVVIGTEVAYRETLFEKSLTVEADIQKNFSNGVLNFFELLSNIGTAKITLTVFGIVFVFLPLNFSYSLMCAIIYSSFFTNFFKIIYRSPRPIWKSDDIKISCNNGFGNPSGHSFTSMCVYLSLAHLLTNFNYFYKKTIGVVLRVVIFIVLIVTIGLVLFSRIVLGAHSINQVIYGGMLGFGTYFVLFFIIGLHNHTPKEFYDYMSNKTTLIISSAINAVLFFSALFVYLFSKEVDEALIKEYDGRLTNKGCKEKKEYQRYQHDGFYQTLSIFGIEGANIAIWLLFYIIEKQYNGSSEHVVVFNKNSDVKNFFCRLGLVIVSALGILLYFVIPGSWSIAVVLIFKSALGFFLGLFGLHLLGIYLCVRLKVANPDIYINPLHVGGTTNIITNA